MTYISDKPGIVSTLNSTTTALSASATFVGTYEDITDYSIVTVNLGTGAPANCSGSLYFEFSQDGTTSDRLVTIPVSDISNASPGIHTLIPIAKYFRVKYGNGTQAQSALRIQTIFHKYLSKIPTTRLTQTAGQYADVENVRAILAGQDSAGNVRNNKANANGDISVEIAAPLSPFGLVSVATRTPAIQIDFVYGYNSDTMLSGSFVNGSVNMTNNMAVIATSTDVGSTAFLRSRRSAKYRAGQGISAYWTSVFSSPVTNSLQITGPFTIISGFGFGYSGNYFGVLHRNDGVREVQTLTIGTGTGGVSENATVTLDGVAFPITIGANLSVTGVVNRIASFSYLPSVTASAASGYGWEAEPLENTVKFISRRAFSHTGTFSLSSSGTASGSFSETVAGVAPTDTWISQSAWNRDTLDGTNSIYNPSGMLINPQKGNVYRVDWQYLGFGKVDFYVEAENGRQALVHTLQFANSRTTPTLIVPSLHLNMVVASQGSTSVLSTSIGSMAAFTHGISANLGPKKSLLNSKNSVGTTLTNILSIRNNYVYKNKHNLTEVVLNILSVACDGTRNADFYVILNGTLGGTPNWSLVDANTSCVSYDTSGTTVTGGTQKYAFTVAKTGDAIINLQQLFSIIAPGETITLAAKASSGTTDVDMSLTWIED
jgi:hypothetical protein